MTSTLKVKSIIYIVIAASLWGMISLFNRQLTASGFGQVEIVFVRSLSAMAATFVYVYFKDKSMLKIKIKDIWCFIGTGIISLLFFNICYFNAMQENISAAAVLLYTAPAFVVVMSAFLFKERFTAAKIISLILITAGCVFVTGVLTASSVKISYACILFGIGSGLGYAMYSIFGRYALNKGYSSETISLYTFVLSSIGALPLISVTSVVQKITFSSFMGIVGIGILCCFLPYLFYTKGLAGVKTGQASVIATVEPVVATVISIAYGDSFGWNSAFGIFLVIAGIFVISLSNES